MLASARTEDEKIEAYKVLKESYKMGNNDAAAEYGYYYYVGNGPVKQDKQKALKLFKKVSKENFNFLK